MESHAIDFVGPGKTVESEIVTRELMDIKGSQWMIFLL